MTDVTAPEADNEVAGRAIEPGPRLAVGKPPPNTGAVNPP